MIKKNKGFTLIELTIVLMVLFLIAGGIIGGKSLIDSAKVYSIISELDDHQKRIKSFQTKYFALPGDMEDAADYWPGVGNGNGNQRYLAKEPDIALIWKHLTNADIMKGNYTGTLAAGDAEVIGSTSPQSNTFSHAGFGMLTVSAAEMNAGGYFSTMKPHNNYLTYGSDESHAPTGSSNPVKRIMNGSISTDMAYSIDKKIDDGLPGTGNILAYPPTPSGGAVLPYCATGDDPSTAKYALSNTGATDCAIANRVH